MFEEQFSVLHHTIEVIDTSSKNANEIERAHLMEKLSSIRELGVSWLDQWMALDEKIADVFDKLNNDKPLPTRTGIDSTVRVRFSPEPKQVQLETVIFDMANYTEVSLRKGLAYFELFMFEEAASALERVVPNPESMEAALLLAASYAAMDRLTDSQNLVDSIKNSTDNPRIICAASEIEAYVHLRKGNLEGAIRSYLDALSAMPMYSDVWFNLGTCYLAANDGVAAERMLGHFLKNNPDDREAVLLHICALVHQGKYYDAFEHCTKAYRVYPDYFDLQIVYSHICQLAGKLHLGESLSRSMMKKFPDKVHGYLHSSWYALSRGEHDSSNAILKKLLSIIPNHPVALLLLVASNLVNSAQPIPMKLLNITNLEAPFADLLSIISGIVQMQTNGADEDLDIQFGHAIESPNPFIRRLAAYIFGIQLMKQNRFSEAIRYLQLANSSGPPNYAILIALHEAALILNRNDEAKIFLEQASLVQDKDLLKCN